MASLPISFNFFNVVALPRHEEPHDRVLEWLLDPSAGHGIPSFAASIIAELWAIPFSEPIRLVKRQYQLSVASYPDIGVEFSSALFILENKVDSGALREGQLELQSTLGKERQRGKALFHVLLHPDRLNVDGIALQDPSFRTLKYGTLARLIGVASKIATSEDARLVLKHYEEYLKQTLSKAPPRGVRMASGVKIARRNLQTGWSEEAFIAQATSSCDAAMLQKQADLLELLRSMDAVEVRFDAVGPTNATYKVYIAGTQIHLLWVYADGRLYPTWKPLRTAGRDDAVEFWKGQWGTSISAENKNDSFAEGGLRRFEVDAVAQKLQAVADVMQPPAT